MGDPRDLVGQMEEQNVGQTDANGEDVRHVEQDVEAEWDSGSKTFLSEMKTFCGNKNVFVLSFSFHLASVSSTQSSTLSVRRLGCFE